MISITDVLFVVPVSKSDFGASTVAVSRTRCKDIHVSPHKTYHTREVEPRSGDLGLASICDCDVRLRSGDPSLTSGTYYCRLQRDRDSRS